MDNVYSVAGVPCVITKKSAKSGKVFTALAVDVGYATKYLNFEGMVLCELLGLTVPAWNELVSGWRKEAENGKTVVVPLSFGD